LSSRMMSWLSCGRPTNWYSCHGLQWKTMLSTLTYVNAIVGVAQSA
jgi:hypothetical protein